MKQNITEKDQPDRAAKEEAPTNPLKDSEACLRFDRVEGQKGHRDADENDNTQAFAHGYPGIIKCLIGFLTFTLLFYIFTGLFTHGRSTPFINDEMNNDIYIMAIQVEIKK